MADSKRVELVFNEVQPKDTSGEHERKIESALENFTAMVCEATNAQNDKDGKTRITKSQARKIVLYWSKNL